jgi:hypothetical protein
MQHCLSIAKKWKDISEFDKIPVPINPYKPKAVAEESIKIKQWKSATLYKAIMILIRIHKT